MKIYYILGGLFVAKWILLVPPVASLRKFIVQLLVIMAARFNTSQSIGRLSPGAPTRGAGWASAHSGNN